MLGCESVLVGVRAADQSRQGRGDPDFSVLDGAVAAADINYYINAWVAGDAAIAVVTTHGAGIGDSTYGVPDGVV